MAVTSNDRAVLAGSVVFQNRVRQALLAACSSVKNEGWSVPFHRERETFVAAVVSQPELYKVLFANLSANYTGVIDGATEVGTVSLTEANVDAQALLVDDGYLNDSIAAEFNTFFRTPAN